jgi:hypothetical protein
VESVEEKEKSGLWQKPQAPNLRPSDTAPTLWQKNGRAGSKTTSPRDLSQEGTVEHKDIPNVLSNKTSECIEGNELKAGSRRNHG